jgi:hypothetical protein
MGKFLDNKQLNMVPLWLAMAPAIQEINKVGKRL